jgi:cytochrome b pre-mRNA-processing protein 3
MLAGTPTPLRFLKRLFQRSEAPERHLYAAIVAAARHPVPYAHWGVPDTVDGRFDMLALYMFLALDRLKGEEGALGQGLVDAFFADMDRSLREMGVGDLSVGKKVRRMAEAFYGRIAAYDAALKGGEDAFAEAIARNVFAGAAPQGGAERLAAHARDARNLLAGQATNRLATGAASFPEPRP